MNNYLLLLDSRRRLCHIWLTSEESEMLTQCAGQRDKIERLFDKIAQRHPAINLGFPEHRFNPAE